jgi:arylsulfatase A-like enzyme
MTDTTRHVRGRSILPAVLGLLLATRTASADCKQLGQLLNLARSIAGAFACARLTTDSVSCTPPAPPACAGSLRDDLLAFARPNGVDVTAEGRHTLSPEIRCQRAIMQAVSRFARDRLQSATLGIPARKADAHAATKLRRLPALCGTFGPGLGGATVPRIGAPCAEVDGRQLASCVRTTLGAWLEPVLRGRIKPSIVLILTDDQPASMLEPMERLRTDLIGDRGVVFGRATGTTPLCAPGRASILTGRYAHGHGVTGNFYPNNFWGFDDSSTIATWLHGGGYRTGLFGKYLNGYVGQSPRADYTGPLPYVPPGWDEWHVFTSLEFFNYSLTENRTVRSYGSAEADYSTDVLAAKAVDFIRTSGEAPFFMVFAPYAPHDPATPAPRHAGRYSGVPPWRPANYDEADVSDKGIWLRELTPPLSPEKVAFLDGLYPKMLESLLAVDEAIGAIMDALRAAGRDEDTLVVFTSDNGLSLGSHRWGGKICPYEECLHIPLVVRYPRLVESARIDDREVANIDFAATFSEFAGVAPGRPVDGVSLAPLLDGSASTWRSDILAEQWSYIPTAFRAVRDGRWAYIEYSIVPPLIGQEAELYDLEADPYELTSLDGLPAYHDIQKALADRVRALDPGWTQPPP